MQFTSAALENWHKKSCEDRYIKTEEKLNLHLPDSENTTYCNRTKKGTSAGEKIPAPKKEVQLLKFKLIERSFIHCLCKTFFKCSQGLA